MRLKLLQVNYITYIFIHSEKRFIPLPRAWSTKVSKPLNGMVGTHFLSRLNFNLIDKSKGLVAQNNSLIRILVLKYCPVLLHNPATCFQGLYLLCWFDLNWSLLGSIPTGECPPYTIACPMNPDICISPSDFCNGNEDCPSGMDENMNCTDTGELVFWVGICF